MSMPATTRSVTKYQGGRGFVLVKLSNEKSQKVEMESVTLTVTNTVKAISGSENNFPVAYIVTGGEAAVEGTFAEVIDEEAFRYLMGYEKLVGTGVKDYFKFVGTVTGGELDFSSAIPSGGTAEAESLYVRDLESGEDLADSEYAVGVNELTGLESLNGRELVIEGTYTMDDGMWQYMGDNPALACTELRLVFPLADSTGAGGRSYRVIKVPRAYLVRDVAIRGEDNPLAQTLKFRIVPDPAGVLFYENVRLIST